MLLLHPCLNSQLLLQTFPECCGAGQTHATFFSLCVCLCLFSLIDFPLFNLEFSWAVVSRGGAATQTGWRKVGSLCLINTVSHMSSELPRIFMQDPSLSSFGPHQFPKDGWNTASFVLTASHALLVSRLRTSVVHKSLSSQPPQTTGPITHCGEGGGSQQGVWRQEGRLGPFLAA